MRPATTTNVITNLLHAVFLGSYFVFALIYHRSGRTTNGVVCFPVPVVFAAGLTFVMKLIGAYVHFIPDSIAGPIWILLGAMLTMLSYFITEALRPTTTIVRVVLASCLILNYLYIITNFKFVLIVGT